MSFQPSPIDLAWAAGLFDGEGSSFIDRRKHLAYPCLKIGMQEKDVLERLQSIVAGRIHGPHVVKGRNKPMWYWVAWNKEAIRVMGLIEPFLSSPKQAQFQKVRIELGLIDKPV